MRLLVVLVALGLTSGAALATTEQWLDTVDEWRIGMGDDVILGSVVAITRDSNGTTFILDGQANTIHVVAPDGTPLAPIGRAGEGPAEFRRGRELLWLSSDLLVLQESPARAVRIATSGIARSDVSIPGRGSGHVFLSGGAQAGAHIVFHLGLFKRTETSVGLETKFVRLNSDEEGEVCWTYFQDANLADLSSSERDDSFPVWSLDENGRFYISMDWEQFLIETVNVDGSLGPEIRREVAATQRSQAHLSVLEAKKTAGKLPSDYRVSDTHRTIQMIQANPGGGVRVISGAGKHGQSSGVIVQFDRFNSLGRLEGSTVVRGEFAYGRDSFHLTSEYIYVVTNTGHLAGAQSFEDTYGVGEDEVVVVCKRLVADQVSIRGAGEKL